MGFAVRGFWAGLLMPFKPKTFNLAQGGIGRRVFFENQT